MLSCCSVARSTWSPSWLLKLLLLCSESFLALKLVQKVRGWQLSPHVLEQESSWDNAARMETSCLALQHSWVLLVCLQGGCRGGSQEALRELGDVTAVGDSVPAPQGVVPTAQRAAIVVGVELPVYDITKKHLILSGLMGDTIFAHFV